jgi:Hint domain
MTGDIETFGAGAQRTRRNIVKMGAIAASFVIATLATAKSGVAGNGQGGNGQGGNGQGGNGQGGNGQGGNGQGGSGHCLLRGTTILTADGDRKIEDLAAGDMLPTMFGAMVPIQWIARYPLKKSDPSKPWVRDAMPVRIARSALAQGVPQADLYVTENHALFVDGLLIAAGNLINGATIMRHEAREYDKLEFFNIKLERHDVIYAEGAPVEALLDVDERAVNFAEYFRKYGAPKMQGAPCAPRVSYGGGRGELRSRLRSAISPWLDRREPVDVIRDRLEERGLALPRQLEPCP